MENGLVPVLTASEGRDACLAKVRAAEKELAELHKRMDTDRDLYLMKPFVYRNFDGKAMPRVRNITLNAASAYAEQAISTLSGANQQVVVEGVVDRVARKIEEFVSDLVVDMDEALADEGDPGLFTYLVEQSLLRGRMACRVLILPGDNGPRVCVTPWDTRFVSYRTSGRSLMWAAYRSYRTREDLEEEYGDLGVRAKKSKAEVYDFWDRNENRVYADGKVILQQAHGLGVVPVALCVVPSGTGMRDDTAAKHRGESIFALNRSLYPELDRIVTVMQTLTDMCLRPPVQRMSKEGELAAPVEEYPYQQGAVWNVEPGGGFMPMPIADIHGATRHLYSIVEGYLQRGALPAVDYGNLTFPLSAVALTSLGDKADKLYIPRLQALGVEYRQIVQLVLKQFGQFGGTLELGEEGRKRTHSYENLKGEYRVSFKYFAQSPEQDIANYAVAARARQFLDEDTVLRNILKLQDPEGVVSRRRADMAEVADPVVGMLRLVHALIDQAKDDPARDAEARVLFEQVKVLLNQRKAGVLAGAPEQGGGGVLQGPQSADGELPLFSASGGRGTASGELSNEAREVTSGKPDAQGS